MAAASDLLKIRAVGIFRYFTRHRTAANLLLLLMVLAGVAAAPNMRAQFFPDVVSDNITVTMRWAGAGAADVDAGIVQILEPALLAVEGVAGSVARSSEGSARITLEFEPGWDMSRAASDVQDVLDAVSNLPADADDPRLRRGGWSDRVTDVVVTGPVGVDQLGRIADEFVARLFDAGITRTSVRGIASPEITVEVTSAALLRHDVTLDEIARAIRAEISADPAGDVGGGTSRVRTGQERRSAEAISAIALRALPDGTRLTIGDVATIETGAIDRGAAFFVGAQPAITLRVDRSETGDAIDIQARTAAVAAEMQRELPEGVRVELVRTRAEVISGRLELLLRNAAMGLVLVVGLLFLFLNARTAFWVAAGIPVAMTAAIAAMYAMGLSFNMISLFALIITLGIVVDDAIVVGEHADYRRRNLGESPAEAAENAATRMAMPVFAATLTTVLAFMGLIAIGGRFGTLIQDIPLTVIAVLIASLVECFLILPNHMYHALAGSIRERWYDLPSRVVNRGFDWAKERMFRPFIRLVIWARYPVVGFAVLLLAVQAAALVRGDITWRFFNQPEQGSITGNFAMLPGSTREDTLEMMRELQRAAEAIGARYEAETGVNPLVFVMGQISGSAGPGLASGENRDADLLGGISIDLVDVDLRPFSSFEFLGELQRTVRAHPRLEELSFRSFGAGPGGDSLSVDFFGAVAATLKAAAEALRAAVAVFPEVSGVEDSMAYDREELLLQLTPQGRALGFTVDGLAQSLRQRIGGIEAATFPEGVRTASVRVRVPEAELSADFLDSMLLRAGPGRYVPLADIVTVETRVGFSTVRRENGVRLISVTGSISEDDPARAAAIMVELRDRIVPAIEEEFGVRSRLSGLAQQEREFLSDATRGAILCLVGIYLVLAWVFSSWTRPMVIMAVIPFGLIGAIWGHGHWGMAMSMFSVVGLIGMAGIIINDSIVLVSTVDQYAKGRGLLPAIVDAACDRLRPVLLTTLTTVLGLGPLLFERSSQAEFLKPTVITLVYGLAFGMFLVLLLVPALLAIGFDIKRRADAFRRSLRVPQGGRVLGAVLGLAVAGGVALFALTLGHVFLTGSVAGVIIDQLPLLTGFAPLGAALLAFGGGLAGIVVVAFLLGAAAVAASRQGAATRG